MLEVQQALRARLLHLNFHAFARCMSDLLRELGFDEVRLAGRLDWKGRNKDGGYDLIAYTPERLAAELVRLLREPAAAAAQRAAFAEVLDMLRPESGLAPSEAAAEAVLEVVES